MRKLGLGFGMSVLSLFLMCAALATQVDRSQSLIVAATIAVGFLNWLAVRNRNTSDRV